MPEKTDSDVARTFERHVARLLLVLFYCGRPTVGLFEGETRQIESKARLGRLDFWVREPGHLALALLNAYATTPNVFEGREAALHAAIERSLADAQADKRRVLMPGGLRPTAQIDEMLAFLVSRALISDRPSFTRGGAHLIVLEQRGLEFVAQLLAACPLLDWYRAQCETVAEFAPTLEQTDLTAMPYLAPDLTPALAASFPFTPIIAGRYQRIFAR